MKFRPCIDIHNGCVKQIVGGSLADKNSAADENFVSEYGGGHYAELYKSRGLSGGTYHYFKSCRLGILRG
ncbi:MAG: hypothetical protein ACLSHR_00175 [Oscillospiraceae bacterium]